MLKHSESLDDLFRALADPSRRSMIEHLGRGPASVSELAAPLRMSLPAVVQHLRILEASGIVRTRKTGRVRSCTLEADALSLAQQWIGERRLAWEQRLDRLGALIERETPSQGAKP